MYLNKVFLIGNLTRDPEFRSLPSGAPVCSFAIATNRVWKDREGRKQEDTQYHNIVVFGNQAETVNRYLRKGSSAMVEGRMQTRSWDDKNTGEKKYRTEVVADRVQFGPKSGGGSVSDQKEAAGAQAPGEAPAKPELATIEYPEEEINPDDIPF